MKDRKHKPCPKCKSEDIKWKNYVQPVVFDRSDPHGLTRNRKDRLMVWCEDCGFNINGDALEVLQRWNGGKESEPKDDCPLPFRGGQRRVEVTNNNGRGKPDYGYFVGFNYGRLVLECKDGFINNWEFDYKFKFIDP